MTGLLVVCGVISFLGGFMAGFMAGVTWWEFTPWRYRGNPDD